MREINSSLIYKAIYDSALHCVTHVDEATFCAIKQAAAKETFETAKFALDTIIKNDILAAAEQLPMCQDTGMAVIFLEIGQDVHIIGDIEEAVNNAVRDSYKDGYFRKSVLDPLTRINTKDNTPAVIHTEIVKGDKVRVSFLAKGFGSENMSKLFMLTPADGIEGIKKSVIDTVRAASGNPCPPIIVGIGIGGTMEKAAILSKKALLVGTNVHNKNENIAKLENELLDLINDLGIGALGFKGVTTALSVNILTYPTHIAGLPVAINLQCHAVRHETIEL
ncbi:MAG: fumarate hydratase [Clostridia bacterium]